MRLPPSRTRALVPLVLLCTVLAGFTTAWVGTAATSGLTRDGDGAAAAAALPAPHEDAPNEDAAHEDAPAAAAGADTSGVPTGSAGSAAAASPTAASTAPGAPTEVPSCTPLPLEDRAAAVLVVGLPHVVGPDEPLARSVADLGVGGVFLAESNIRSAWQVGRLVEGLQERSDRPMLISTDEESGRVAVARHVVGAGPSPRRLAAERTPLEVRDVAAGIGEKLRDIGVTLDLAPLLDLDDGPYDGIIGDRSFSHDPHLAAEYGLAFSAGLADAGVLPTVKHFPGHGRSTTDTHADGALVEVTAAELRATDLLPFQRAIDAGAPVVMLNHLQYSSLDPELPASVAPGAYALLREMGFQGVAITDSLGMGAVHGRWDFPESATLAIIAGADAVLTTNGHHAERMRDALVEAVRSGRLPEQRLSQAAARVTALAGGDPVEMSCLEVELPTLSVPEPRAEHDAATP